MEALDLEHIFFTVCLLSQNSTKVIRIKMCYLVGEEIQTFHKHTKINGQWYNFAILLLWHLPPGTLEQFLVCTFMEFYFNSFNFLLQLRELMNKKRILMRFCSSNDLRRKSRSPPRKKFTRMSIIESSIL